MLTGWLAACLRCTGSYTQVSSDLVRADRSPNAARSSLQVGFDFLLLAAAIAGVILVPLPWKLLVAAGLGVVLARMFVLGHDACHGSLFKSKLANEIVGRLLFLPTLTTFSLWHVGHNVAHHGFANLKGRDQVWVPFSPEEFAQLPKWRRGLERIYRSIWGFGLYYFVELWWSKLFFPSKRHIGAKRRVFIFDSVVTAAIALGYLAFLVAMAVVTDQSWWWMIVVGAVVPFVIWNYIMGLVIFVHHTGPDMVWFDKRSEWLRLRKVDDLTRDFRLPFGLDRILHGIMLHRAHHFDPHVPNYRLKSATQRLIAEGIASARATFAGWRYLRDLTRRCALYDYRAHQWVAFPGRPVAVAV